MKPGDLSLLSSNRFGLTRHVQGCHIDLPNAFDQTQQQWPVAEDSKGPCLVCEASALSTKDPLHCSDLVGLYSRPGAPDKVPGDRLPVSMDCAATGHDGSIPGNS